MFVYIKLPSKIKTMIQYVIALFDPNQAQCYYLDTHSFIIIRMEFIWTKVTYDYPPPSALCMHTRARQASLKNWDLKIDEFWGTLTLCHFLYGKILPPLRKLSHNYSDGPTTLQKLDVLFCKINFCLKKGIVGCP